MPLPPQVQASLAAADATLAAMNAPPPAPTPPAEPPAPAAPVQAPVATPPVAAPVAAPAPAVQDPALEQRYRTLQGIHRTLNDKVQNMEAELRQLRAQVSAPPPPAPTPAPQPVADPKDVETFGLDMVTMVQRTADAYLAAARTQFEARLAGIEAAVQQLSGNLKGTTQSIAKTAEDLFFARLAELIPNWAEINEQPGWLAYLAEVDPIYRVARQVALNRAQEVGDASQAAAVFNAYIATLPPAPVAPPPESPSPRATASAPPPAPAASSATVISVKEIEGFYADVAKGRYRQNQQEQLRKEAIYNAAISEGRIIP